MRFGIISSSPWKLVSQEQFNNALKGKVTQSQVTEFLEPEMKFYWDANVNLDIGASKYKTAIAAIALNAEKEYFIKKSLLQKDRS